MSVVGLNNFQPFFIKILNPSSVGGKSTLRGNSEVLKLRNLNSRENSVHEIDRLENLMYKLKISSDMLSASSLVGAGEICWLGWRNGIEG